MSIKRTRSTDLSSDEAKTEGIRNKSERTSKYFKPPSRLVGDFYDNPCLVLAKSLLGKVLCRKLPGGELLKGKIVETESYLGEEDVASHSYKGKQTPRNAAMFMKPGTAYVYVIYGMYNCFNISSQENGSAVLLRALEPLAGFETMKVKRSIKRKEGAKELKITDLCSGPSKLCQSFSVNKELDKVDMCTSEDIWLEEGGDMDDMMIVTSSRIGISSCGPEWAGKPLRFYIHGNKHVSVRDKKTEAQMYPKT